MLSTIRAYVLLMFCSSACFAESAFEAQQLHFKGLLGARAGDNTVYCLMGLGFIRAPRTNNVDQVASAWLANHPNAVVTLVDSGLVIGRPGSVVGRSGGSLQYIWIEDGDENLNVFLVSEGTLLAGEMADPASAMNLQRTPMEAWEKPLTRLVTNDRYNAFIKRAEQAEAQAKQNKKGLWSDEYKGIMEGN